MKSIKLIFVLSFCLFLENIHCLNYSKNILPLSKELQSIINNYGKNNCYNNTECAYTHNEELYTGNFVIAYPSIGYKYQTHSNQYNYTSPFSKVENDHVFYIGNFFRRLKDNINKKKFQYIFFDPETKGYILIGSDKNAYQLNFLNDSIFSAYEANNVQKQLFYGGYRFDKAIKMEQNFKKKQIEQNNTKTKNNFIQKYIKFELNDFFKNNNKINDTFEDPLKQYKDKPIKEKHIIELQKHIL